MDWEGAKKGETRYANRDVLIVVIEQLGAKTDEEHETMFDLRMSEYGDKILLEKDLVAVREDLRQWQEKGGDEVV